MVKKKMSPCDSGDNECIAVLVVVPFTGVVAVAFVVFIGTLAIRRVLLHLQQRREWPEPSTLRDHSDNSVSA